MFSANLINIGNIFNFSFSGTKKKKKFGTGLDAVFFSIQFDKNIASQTDIINSIKDAELALINDDYSIHDLHRDSYIIALHHKFISKDGIISPLNYCEVLSKIRTTHIAIFGDFYKAYPSEKYAYAHIIHHWLDHNTTLLSMRNPINSTAQKKVAKEDLFGKHIRKVTFEKTTGQTIHTVKNESGKKIALLIEAH